MQIANPLYDTVFKYLLEDEPVAKLFLSTLLEKDIEHLFYNPQEMVQEHPDSTKKIKSLEPFEADNPPIYSVLRLDFSARVRYDDGRIETILIEVQKASNTGDLMRFRRYIGGQLQSRNNAIKDKNGLYHPFPIYPIYFLGEGLPNIKGHSAVKVERICYDAFTKKRLYTRDNFIENLTYDSLVICTNERQLAVETGFQKLISIFNLASKFKDVHILTINESDYPPEHRPIIRRLQQASEQAVVRKQMDDEDDYLSQLIAEQRKTSAAEAQIAIERSGREKAEIQVEKERKEKEKERKSKEKAEMQVEKERKEKEKERKSKEKAEMQVEKERKNKEKAEMQVKTAIIALYHAGISVSDIAKSLNISKQQVEGAIN
jgi:hypothetical protein